MTPASLRRRAGLTAGIAAAAGVLVVLAGGAGPPVPAAATNAGMVVTGLDNPRGLAVDDDGRLYVAEAGHGGPFCLRTGELGPECFGMTSRISVVAPGDGHRRTVVGGLPSIGTALGANGADGVAVERDRLLAILTSSPAHLPEDPCNTPTPPGSRPSASPSLVSPDCPRVLAEVGRLLGDLIEVRDGRVRSLAEVGGYDYDWVVRHKATLGPNNPDWRPGDAKPYALAVGADRIYVVDASANTLDVVDRFGNVRVPKDDAGHPVYFPNPAGPIGRFPYAAMPTCVAVAGRSVYVGSLSGGVWRWDGHRVSLVAGRANGLTALNGCATDSHGNLYVSNVFGLAGSLYAPRTGSVLKVTADGSISTVAAGLNFPAGIAVAGDALFVAVNSVCPEDLKLIDRNDPKFCDATGAILRLPL
jgi:hypothetical protein